MLQLYKGARAFFQQEISLYYDNCFTAVELQEAAHQFFHSQLSAKKKKFNSDWQLEVKYKSTGSQFRPGVTSTIAGWISAHSGEGVAFTIKVNPIDVDKETYKMWQQEQVQQEVIKMPVEDLKELNAGVSAPSAIWKYWASLVEKREASSTIIPTDLSRFFNSVNQPESDDEDENFGNDVAQMLSRELLRIDAERNRFEEVQRTILFKKVAGFCQSLKRRSVVQDLCHLLSVP
ncbi:hypothetical protein P9112_011831 [Eukaryota sp. TZLM1-RC]